MNAADCSDSTGTPLDPHVDSDAGLVEQVDSLRAAGAERFDPVGFHYIEVLARRATTQQEDVKRILEAKLRQAIATVQERFDQAQRDAKETVDKSVHQYPHAANDIQRLFAAGDFKALHRHIENLKAGEQDASFTSLVRQLEQHTPGHPEVREESRAGSRSELKAVSHFRNTWSKLSVDNQLTKALEQAPKNAGPINSHMLVLRSLALMRDISPDYLNRFISYADALLCLDQGEKEVPTTQKKQRVMKTAKK